MKARAFALACCAALLASACGDDGGGSGDAATTTQPLRCTMGEVRACPCIGQGMGTQTCNATGNGFGTCTGCPAPSAPPRAGSSPTGGGSGTSAAVTAGRAGSMGSAGVTASAGAGAGAGGGGNAGAGTAGASGASGMGGAGGSDSSASPATGTAPGVSCGVGLPALCSLESEKCCVRSLQTDTCIPAGDTCSCTLSGCTVMEARCDGPEDCPSGQVCCGTLSSNGMGYDRFVCAAQCMSTGNQRVACHEDMKTCPSNLVCANSQLLTNVQVCIDPATIEQ
jgi:hypothetical protein